MVAVAEGTSFRQHRHCWWHHSPMRKVLPLAVVELPVEATCTGSDGGNKPMPFSK